MKNKKTRLWGVTALSILFLGLLSCGDGPQKPKDEKLHTEEGEGEVGGAPDGIISLDEAKVLCENYETRRSKSIIVFEKEQNELDEEFVPTQFIDFDFKELKKYIKHVEREARRAKVKPDSLRIYLGNYGKDGTEPNRNTVFILPTAKVNGDHGGFFINAKGNAELIRNYWPNSEEEQKSKASLLPSFNPTLYQGKSLIFNRGHGGPPPTGDF